ncbi:MAG: hypothetical protein EOO73_09335 [Myxococcales bacterium]|nr:MAG: hypothetical protein EOO73_09335 [Myxococcales bacterium]
MFSAKFTLGLLAFLLVPFAIKSVVYAEPWPAVVLPSGAIKISVTEGVAHFPTTAVSIVAEDGARQRLGPRVMFQPVPPHYLFTLQAGGFGQDRREYREIGLKRGGALGLTALRFPRHTPTEQEREEARTWLRNNARLAGLSGDRLSIRNQVVHVAMQSGQELSREDADETLVPIR